MKWKMEWNGMEWNGKWKGKFLLVFCGMEKQCNGKWNGNGME